MFTELVQKLGVRNIEINDLYSIDSESLRELQPIYGIIFLFKYGSLDREHAQSNQPITGQYDPLYLDKLIFFANQTIQNACATQAVLNILFNLLEKDGVKLGEELSNFKNFVQGFDGEMIGETISNSDLIRSVHNSFLTPSLLSIDRKDQNNVDEKDDGLFHFVGYTFRNGQIYELDGLKQYPITHGNAGECKTQDDFIDKIPGIIQERIAKYDSNELRFSLLAVTNDKLEEAKLRLDEFGITQQLHKREVWHKENELRKMDYTGLIVQLIKNISNEKTDSEWEEMLTKGRNKTQEMIAASLRKK